MQVYTAGSIWIFICSPDDKLREAEHQSRLFIYNWQRDSFELCSKFSTGLGCGACSSICWVSVHHLYATHSASKIMSLSLIKAAALQEAGIETQRERKLLFGKSSEALPSSSFMLGWNATHVSSLSSSNKHAFKDWSYFYTAFPILTVPILKLWVESHWSYNKTSSFPLN